MKAEQAQSEGGFGCTTQLDTNNTVRVFTGNVADAVIGQPNYMGGTMSIQNAAFGDLGEFNFSAVN